MSQKIQPVVLTIVRKDDRILLTRRAEADPEDRTFHDVWQIPGGGMEFAETPEETAFREAREELGIDIEIVSLVPKLYTSVRGNWQGLLIAYECTMRFPEQPIVINHEASEFKWATLQEMKRMELTPFSEMLVQEVLT